MVKADSPVPVIMVKPPVVCVESQSQSAIVLTRICMICCYDLLRGGTAAIIVVYPIYIIYVLWYMAFMEQSTLTGDRNNRSDQLVFCIGKEKSGSSVS